MNNLSTRGSLSVEEMNALFEHRLRVNLPGGSFKVIQRTYSNSSPIKVYDGQLSLSMVIRLEPEGHIIPLEPVPAAAKSDASLFTGKRSQSN